MPNAEAVAKLGAYKRVDVETTSQGKLVVLLFNGALQRAEEAKRQIAKGRIEGVHNNLIRAQEIIGELRGALNMSAGRIATDLDRVYEYLQHLLIKGNIEKKPEPIDECIGHMAALRDTWQEAFATLAQSEKPKAPMINPHGSSVVNLQG